MLGLQATLWESSAEISNVPSLQCNGAFNPKYFLAGFGQQGVYQEGWAVRQHSSWLANQGIGILAQVVFPPVMRMHWDGAVMAQETLWGQKSGCPKCNRSASSSLVRVRSGSYWLQYGAGEQMWHKWERGSAMVASPRSSGQRGMRSGVTSCNPSSAQGCPLPAQSHLHQPLPVLHESHHGFLASEWISANCGV